MITLGSVLRRRWGVSLPFRRKEEEGRREKEEGKVGSIASV
jgi:hypothetical protein